MLKPIDMTGTHKNILPAPASGQTASAIVRPGVSGLFFSAEDILVRLRAPQVDITQRVVGKLPIAPSANPQGDKFAHPDSVHGSNALIAEAGPWNANKHTLRLRTAAATRTSTGVATNGPRTGIASLAHAPAPTGLIAASPRIFARRRGASPCCESFKSFWSTNLPETSGATAEESN